MAELLETNRSQLERDINRFQSGAWQRLADRLAVEEPLEIRIDHDHGGQRETFPLTITMRTPGDDFALAAGFLFGEGIVSRREDITGIDYATDLVSEPDQQNTLVVSLRDGLDVNLEGQRRNFAVTSACGVCGKASLAALAMNGCPPISSAVTVSAEKLTAMPAALREAQLGFEATGGVHAAAAFRPDGTLVGLGEDVGRHNAFDKLVGGQFLARNAESLGEVVALLSGRASYELLQKALRARVPIVAAVGAPSSLAVEIAENFGITLVGFLKPGSFNVYAGRERICD
jgi:FdhD protein